MPIFHIEKLINKNFKSDFAKNVLTLLTGSTIAQILPFIAAPVLTRLYGPEDFGTVALFVSVVHIFGAVSNGRYEFAILIPKRERDSLHIVILSFIIAFFASFFLFFLILIFHDQIINILNAPKLEMWLYFIPLSVLLTGTYNALNYFNTRKKEFRYIAFSKIYRSFSKSLIQIIVGFVKIIKGGLVLGQIGSLFFGNYQLLKVFLKEKKELKKISLFKIKFLAKKYKDFPLYTLPGSFLNQLSLYLVNFLVSWLYSITSVGHYSVASKYLGMPSVLIGRSIQQVYAQEISKKRQKHGNAINTFTSTLKRLLYLGIPIFIILFFIVEDAYAIILGEKWRIAGHYAQIMLPLFFIRFIATPLNITTVIFEKQKIGLIWQIGLILINLFVFTFTYFYNKELEFFLKLRTTLLVVYYLVLIYIVFEISKGHKGLFKAKK
ncbi:MAG: oligosaccharide flippase family protein [Bacteroidales bacterium]|nr:oligosaccharide flippase family protein [Bacteroidales bacterium]